MHPRDEERRQIEDEARRTLGRSYGRRDLSDRSALRGEPISQLERELVEATKPVDVPGHVDMTKAEVRQWSLARAAQAIHAGRLRSTLEGECSEAIRSSLGRNDVDPMSTIFVPRQILTRDLTTVSASALATSRIGGFSGALHRASVLRRLGVPFLGPFVGGQTIPRFASSSTVTWLAGEAAPATESDAVVSGMQLMPRMVGVHTKYSRLLGMQASPMIEDLLFADLGKLVASAIDAVAIGGNGTAEPLGILSVDGVGAVSGTDLGYAGVVEAVADVATANGAVDPVAVAYVTTPAVAQLLKAEFVGTDASPVWRGSLLDGEIEGIRALASNACAASSLVCGDWSQALVLEWGTLMLEIDPFTGFRSGVTGVRAMYAVDVGVRHAASFSVALNIT